MKLIQKVLVLYLDLEGGIFVLKSDKEDIYYPVNLQEKLGQFRGKSIIIEGKTVDSESFQMNGLPIWVDKFSLVN
jgi:hypothetical protein